MLKKSLKTGMGFGLTSGIITTLGLMIGLYSGTRSRIAVLGSIVTIALADSLSDALGIHISQESSTENSHREVWEATMAAFFSKLVLTLSFSLPIIFFPLPKAVAINLVWGLIALVTANYWLARKSNRRPAHFILEHLFIALLVIVASHYLGQLVKDIF